MKNKYYLLFILFFAKNSFAQQWDLVSKGPFNKFSNIIQVIEDPSDNTSKSLWVLTSNNIWKTADFTASQPNWTIKTSGITSFGFQKMTYDMSNNSIIYLIGSTGKLFKSTDGGNQWTLANADLYSLNVQGFKTDNAGNLYLLTSSKLYKSANQGASWTEITSALSTLNSVVDYNDLQIAADGAIYVGSSWGYIYKSTNGGSSFTSITPTSFTVNNNYGYFVQLAIAPSTSGGSQTIYGLCYKNNLGVVWMAKSTNGGTSWTKITLSSSTFSYFLNYYSAKNIFVVHPTNPSIVFAGNQYSKIKSADGGNTWQYFEDFSSTTNGIALKNEKVVFYTSGELKQSDNALQTNNAYSTTPIIAGAGADVKRTQTPHLTNSDTYYLQFTENYQNNIYKYLSSTGSLENLGIKTMIFDKDEPLLNLEEIPGTANYSIVSNNLKRDFSYGTGIYHTISSTDNKMYDHKNNNYYNLSYTPNPYYTSYTYLYVHPAIQNQSNSNFTIQGDPYTTIYTWTKANASNTFFSSGGYPSSLYKWTLSSSDILMSSLVYSSTNFSFGKLFIENNDQLIATVYNSMFYLSQDGGLTWKDKNNLSTGFDYSTYFKDLLINPNNYQEAIVATTTGLYYTSNFLSTNSAWVLCPTIPAIEINSIFFREPDNKVIISTNGLGIYEGTIFQNRAASTIKFTNTPSSLCGGNSYKIPFIDYRGILDTGYILELSDISGNFTNKIALDTTNISPFSFTLPSNLPSSVTYKLRIKSLQTGLYYQDTQSIAINTMSSFDKNLLFQMSNITDSTAIIQIPYSSVPNLYYIAEPSTNTPPSPYQIVNKINASNLDAFRSGQFILDNNSSNQLLYNLQKGTSYKVYITRKTSTSECLSPVQTLSFNTTGSISECIPTNNTADNSVYIIESSLYNSTNSTSFKGYVSRDGQSSTYSNATVKPVVLNRSYSYYMYIKMPSGLPIKIWGDFNHDGLFDASEVLATGFGNNFINITIPINAAIGITKIRMRAFSNATNSNTVDACNYIATSDTQDGFIEIYPKYEDKLYLYTSVNALYATKGSTLDIYRNTVGYPNTGNTYRIEMSDPTGSFDSPQQITTTSGTGGLFSYYIPSNLPSGTNYRFRVVSSNPAVIGLPSTSVRISTNCNSVITRTVNYSGGNQKYEALKIYEDKRSNLDAKMEFKAVNSIEFTPGFYAKPSKNGSYTATVDGCSN